MSKVQHRLLSIALVLSALQSACSTPSSVGLQGARQTFQLPISEERRPISNPLPGVDLARVQVLKVKEASSGVAIVGNRREFLAALLKQSYDTYFGTPKIPKDCLERNQVGEVKSSQGENPSFRARLSVDGLWNPGYCFQDSHNAIALVTFCQSANLVVEVYARGARVQDLDILCGEAPQLIAGEGRR